MIEGVNMTFYTICTIIVYLFLLLYSIVLIYDKAGEMYSQFLSWVRTLLKKNDKVEGFVRLIRSKVFPQITGTASAGLNALRSFSLYIYKFEKFYMLKSGYIPTEAVNYSALAIRKLYDGNPQVWLVYSSLAIVVFYFILTIF